MFIGEEISARSPEAPGRSLWFSAAIGAQHPVGDSTRERVVLAKPGGPLLLGEATDGVIVEEGEVVVDDGDKGEGT